MSTAADSDSTGDVILPGVSTQQFYWIQFSIFLLLIIPSISCSLVALYHLLADRHLRQALHNHIIIILLAINLFYELTDMTCLLHYFRTFQTFQAPLVFHLILGYIDWTFYFIQIMLYAWVTVERHVLIFHDHLHASKTKRLFVHYLPPFLIAAYCLAFHTIIFFASRCTNDSGNVAGIFFTPCAFQDGPLYVYATIMHYILPSFIIVLSSFALLGRVIWRKYRAQRHVHWRRYRKMAVQVLTISSLHGIFIFPLVLMSFLYICGVSYDIGSDFFVLVPYFPYYTLLLFPMVAIGSLPELKEKVKNTIKFRRQRQTVRPSNLATAPMATNRPTV